ncbi:glycosyl hydrolase [Delphinella strobiligena]|nr:glycosyl hydrolase [Delphinella strobiligena]
MNGQNFPDPSLLRVGNDYYAYATSPKISGQRIHVQMARSLSSFDAWTWMGARDALPVLPNWINPTSPQVWAPDVVQLADGTFVMYYTAALASNPKLHCLGVATSGAVLGPFKPTDMTNPWVCPTEQGGAIDPAGYYDATDNTRWVVYKVDGNAIGHGGICNNGNPPIVSTPILLQQVSAADGHTKIGSPSAPLITNGKADGPVVEAPSLSKMDDGTFVLFFSSNCFATPFYDVSYATAKSIRGPYTKYGPMFVTGTLGLTAPGGLDIAVNGYRAVFHANYGGGRAMFTALIGGGGNKWQAYTQTS